MPRCEGCLFLYTKIGWLQKHHASNPQCKKRHDKAVADKAAATAAAASAATAAAVQQDLDNTSEDWDDDEDAPLFGGNSSACSSEDETSESGEENGADEAPEVDDKGVDEEGVDEEGVDEDDLAQIPKDTRIRIRFNDLKNKRRWQLFNGQVVERNDDGTYNCLFLADHSTERLEEDQVARGIVQYERWLSEQNSGLDDENEEMQEEEEETEEQGEEDNAEDTGNDEERQEEEFGIRVGDKVRLEFERVYEDKQGNEKRKVMMPFNGTVSKWDEEVEMWKCYFYGDNTFAHVSGDMVADGKNEYQRWSEKHSPANPLASADLFEGVKNIIDNCRSEGADIYGNPAGEFSHSSEAAVKLLALMQKHDAPLGMYDDIVKWAREAHKKEAFSKGTIPTRSTLLNNLWSRYNMSGIAPQQVPVLLKNANVTVPVITYSFPDTLASLLTDPELMKDENFTFPDGNDPFQPPETWPQNWESNDAFKSKKKIGELVAGKWYSDTYHARCRPGDGKILCPIIIFIDKTHTDAKGRLTQEPVLFTLGIFNQKTRNNPKAWRPLGLMPNFTTIKKSKDVDKRHEDYHQVLSVILQDLKKAQACAGVKVSFPYRGEDNTAVFIIPTAGVLGDHEGQNKICGHKGCNSNYPCRRCRIHKTKLDQPIFGHAISAKEIDRLRRGGADEKKLLHALSHYFLREGSAFYLMDFGADGERGISWMSWPDVLHNLKHGLMDYNRLNLLDEQLPDYKNFHKYWEALRRKDKEYIEREEEEEVQNKVFNEDLTNLVDDVAKYWGKLLTHQSDRSLGRIYSPQGIAKGTSSKFTGGEMPGVMLLFSMVMSSGLGYQFFDTPIDAVLKTTMDTPLVEKGQRFRLDTHRTADYIWAMEEMMLLCEMLNSEVMTVGFVVDCLEPYTKLLMERVTKKLPRFTGDGWCLVKFHNLLHFPEMLLTIGNGKNTDTETGEHWHVRLKQLAQKTQRVLKKFDKQVADRLYEEWATSRAKAELKIDSHSDFGSKPRKRLSAAKFVFKSNEAGEIECEPAREKAGIQWHDKDLLSSVRAFLKRAIFRNLRGEDDYQLGYYTEARISLGSGSEKETVLLRADPAHHTMDGIKFATFSGDRCGWHDLAISKNPAVPDGPDVPVQILGFLKFDSPTQGFIMPATHNCAAPAVAEGSEWAIVHAFKNKLGEDCRKANEQSRLLTLNQKRLADLRNTALKVPKLFLVRLEDMKGKCIGVPNVSAVERVTEAEMKGQQKRKEWVFRTDPTEYIFVESADKWAQIYKDHIEQECERENVAPCHMNQREVADMMVDAQEMLVPAEKPAAPAAEGASKECEDSDSGDGEKSKQTRMIPSAGRKRGRNKKDGETAKEARRAGKAGKKKKQKK